MAGSSARLCQQQLDPGCYRCHGVPKLMGGNGQELIPGTKLRLSLDQRHFERHLPGQWGGAILIDFGS